MKIIKYLPEYRSLTKDFNSGNVILDNFIKSDDAFESSIGVTYIALNDGKDEIIGYYNITTGTFDYNDSGIRVKQCGAAHINYFAVTELYQGLIQYSDDKYDYKLSDIILLDCIDRIGHLRQEIGLGCITLSSTEQGYHLYRREDFDRIDDDFCFSNTSCEASSIDMCYFFNEDI